MSSYIDKLQKLKIDILIKKDELFKNTRITKRNLDIAFFTTCYFNWTSTDEKLQMELRKLYNSYFEKIKLLLNHANDNLKDRILNSHEILMNLIEQKNGTTPESIYSAIEIFNEQIKIYDEFLSLVSNNSERTILIPDTNSLIIQPDPIEYSKLVNSKDFIFLIMPTVLSELDKLKITHRDEDFRKKVKSIIKRFKGYRIQGDIINGVILNKTTTLKMNAKEPNFRNTLEWLDENNMDDRIIASALEIQVQYPSNNVSIVTADLNLQNKATLASLDFYDPDDL